MLNNLENFEDSKNTKLVVSGGNQTTTTTTNSFNQAKVNLLIGLVLNSISVSDEKNLEVKKIGHKLKITKYKKKKTTTTTDIYTCSTFNTSPDDSNIYQAKNDLKDKIEGYFSYNHYVKFLTLTFDPETNKNRDLYSVGQTQKCLKLFILKLQNDYGYFKYVWVAEPHKSGKIHYHLLTDLPYIPLDKFHDYWIYGRSRIECPRGVRDTQRYMQKIAGELAKYLDKSKDSKIFKGHKRYSTSQNVTVVSIFDNKYRYINEILCQKEPDKAGNYFFSNPFYEGENYWFLFPDEIKE